MMIRSPRKVLLIPLFAMLAVAGAILLASCGGDDDNESGGNSHGSAEAVLTAILYLDSAGLHDIDDAINDDGEIPANARTIARKAETVTRLTAWPEELQASANTLADVFAEMAAALEGDAPDLAAAGEAAARAHDVEHDFSGEVWEYLYTEAGVEGGGGGH